MSQALYPDLALRLGATPSDRRAASGLARSVGHAVAVFREWRRLGRSRRELAALDEYQLRDLGLTKSAAMFESDRSFLHH